MDVREKLVGLINDCRFMEGYGMDLVERQADHLIAHGVTVQEWVSVKDRLPHKDGSYLVTANYFGKNQCIDVLGFVKDGETVDKYDLAGQKYVWCLYDSEYGYVSTDSVTYWMPIPQPPKGE